MDVQRALGSDIAMMFDDCTAWPATHAQAEASMQRSMRWAVRCRDHYCRDHDGPPPGALFGIVQGGMYPDLREASLEALMALDLPGLAVGGLALMLGSLVWSMADIWPNEPVTISDELFLRPLQDVGLGLALAVVLALLFARFLPRGWFLTRLAVARPIAGSAQVAGLPPEAGASAAGLVGRVGVAVTGLFPAGQVEVDGGRFEARRTRPGKEKRCPAGPESRSPSPCAESRRRRSRRAGAAAPRASRPFQACRRRRRPNGSAAASTRPAASSRCSGRMDGASTRARSAAAWTRDGPSPGSPTP
jgi:hypothetical protein